MTANVLPILKDTNLVRSIMQTLKQRKFEYVKDALYMSGKKWGLDRKDASVLERCGNFDDETLLDDAMLEDDLLAEEIYLTGVKYLKCVVHLYSTNPAHADKFVYLPFNQVINIHRTNPEVYEVATSIQLGRLAANLLQHNSVRLYQTALFLKEAKSINLKTEWHRDLSMVPLDTREGGSVTFWCPLLRTLSHINDDSMLQFAPGTHRDVSREHWYGPDRPESVEFAQAHTLKVGDCTAHHGWIKHQAPPQPNSNSRLAIGFTYVIGDATVLTDLPAKTSNRYTEFRDEDELSYRDWIKDLKEGDKIDHPLLPLVYEDRVVTPHKNSFRKRHFNEEEMASVKYLYESK